MRVSTYENAPTLPNRHVKLTKREVVEHLLSDQGITPDHFEHLLDHLERIE